MSMPRPPDKIKSKVENRLKKIIFSQHKKENKYM